MARKSKLTAAAATIGTVVGRADRTAHKVAKAAATAREELADLTQQVEALGRQLKKTSKRLRKALR